MPEIITIAKCAVALVAAFFILLAVIKYKGII